MVARMPGAWRCQGRERRGFAGGGAVVAGRRRRVPRLLTCMELVAAPQRHNCMLLACTAQHASGQPHAPACASDAQVVNHCHELGVMHRDLKVGMRPARRRRTRSAAVRTL